MKKKALTYKERQDVIWALEEHAKELEMYADNSEALESAARLRRLRVKFVNGER